MTYRSHIFSMFGSSPVRPLQQHMDKVQACAAQLIDFMESALSGDWDKAAERQRSIVELEGEADTLKRSLRLHLPKGWLMAMSRRDVLEVLTMQDRIANKAKDIAGLILGRRMQFPQDVGQKLLEFVRRSIDASGQAQTAINELDELVETGFRGHEVDLVESMITELDKIEADTDKIQVEIRTMVFVLEKEMHPVDVMFLYRIIEWTGELADVAQRVGSRLELMLAR